LQLTVAEGTPLLLQLTLAHLKELHLPKTRKGSLAGRPKQAFRVLEFRPDLKTPQAFLHWIAYQSHVFLFSHASHACITCLHHMAASHACNTWLL